jgi:uncharacterized protein YoxC
MESYELAIIIALALIAVSVAVGTVFLIIALIKVRKAAIKLEEALHKLNSELDVVSRVSNKVASLTEKNIISGYFSAFSYLLCFIKC